MYICMNNNFCGKGNTLEEAYEDYQNSVDEIAIDDCSFYEATEINVIVKIEKKEVPVQLKPKGK